jgi:hypothetical protein
VTVQHAADQLYQSRIVLSSVSCLFSIACVIVETPRTVCLQAHIKIGILLNIKGLMFIDYLSWAIFFRGGGLFNPSGRRKLKFSGGPEFGSASRSTRSVENP